MVKYLEIEISAENKNGDREIALGKNYSLDTEEIKNSKNITKEKLQIILNKKLIIQIDKIG